MISWGKSGTGGDSDVDDSAIISIYIDPDDGDGLADYGSGDAATIVTDANDGDLTDGEAIQIITGLSENADSREGNWYAWDLWSYTTFTPAENQAYHIYLILDENKTGGSKRVVALGDDGLLTQAVDNLTDLYFVHDPVVKFYNPSPRGDVMNARDIYRFVINAYDLDDNADLDVILTGTDYGRVTVLGTVGDGGSSIRGDNSAAGVDAEWVLNSSNGNMANDIPLNETSATKYDWRAKQFGSATTYLTTDIDADAKVLTDGTYYVYVAADKDNDDFADGNEPAYRAPGTLKIIGMADDPPVEYLFLSPGVFNVAKGDTINLEVWASDNGNVVDAVELYMSIDTTYFNPRSFSAPFTDETSKGSLSINEVLADTSDGRWKVHSFLFNSGNQMDFQNPVAGIPGEKILSLTLLCKGTSDAVPVKSNINFINTETLQTAFYNDGEVVSLTTRLVAGSANIVNRAIVEGIAKLEGRGTVDLNAQISLRQWGSYVDASDSYFSEANDADSTLSGVQVALDNQGKFVLYDVPPGEWNMVIHYDRYLDVGRRISTYAGLDTLIVDYGELSGGDATGYTDSLSNNLPDNQITLADFNQINAALGATADSSKWDNGTNNYMYADIDENGAVETRDLIMATGHENVSGEQPVYKPVAGPEDNSNAVIRFVGVPEKLVEGMSYSIDVMAQNVGDLKGYHVQFTSDASVITVDNILPGDIYNYSFSATTNVGGKPGLINAMYGRGHGFTGEGILATIEFTALKSEAFDEDVLSLVKGEFVTSTLIQTDALVREVSVKDMIPESFELSQNYPNPFNPSTTILFATPERAHVSIRIYNILGQEVRTLTDGEFNAGRFSVRWDGRNNNSQMVAGGVYFYRVVAGRNAAVKKMLFLK